MSPGPALADRLADLRRTFDQSFAAPPPAPAPQQQDLLLVRVAGAPYAMRLAQIAGVFADQPVAPLPGPVAELLGVAAFRGTLVPVYDLAALLGHPPATAPRWLVLAGTGSTLALAFDAVDGHRRIAATGVAAAAGSGHVSGVAHLDAGVRPILNLPAVAAEIAARAANHRTDRETAHGTS